MTRLEAIEWRADLIERAEPHDDWFAYVSSAGIDLRSIYAHAGLLTVTRCQFLSGGRFDWACADEGELAAVIEVLEIDRGGPVTVDLCAWSIVNPTQFGTAMGRASVLGGDQILSPASFFAGKRLLIHRTPLAWVRAGCSGVVVLDKLRGLPRLADALGELMVEDVPHGRELVRGLGAMFDANQIYVPASCAQGAA